MAVGDTKDEARSRTTFMRTVRNLQYHYHYYINVLPIDDILSVDLFWGVHMIMQTSGNCDTWNCRSSTPLRHWRNPVHCRPSRFPVCNFKRMQQVIDIFFWKRDLTGKSQGRRIKEDCVTSEWPSELAVSSPSSHDRSMNSSASLWLCTRRTGGGSSSESSWSDRFKELSSSSSTKQLKRNKRTEKH